MLSSLTGHPSCFDAILNTRFWLFDTGSFSQNPMSSALGYLSTGKFSQFETITDSPVNLWQPECNGCIWYYTYLLFYIQTYFLFLHTTRPSWVSVDFNGRIGDQSAMAWWLVGDYTLRDVYWMVTDRRLAADRSATGCHPATKISVSVICNHCDWSAINRQPKNYQFLVAEVLLTATKTFATCAPTSSATSLPVTAKKHGRRPVAGLVVWLGP